MHVVMDVSVGRSELWSGNSSTFERFPFGIHNFVKAFAFMHVVCFFKKKSP